MVAAAAEACTYCGLPGGDHPNAGSCISALRARLREVEGAEERGLEWLRTRREVAERERVWFAHRAGHLDGWSRRQDHPDGAPYERRVAIAEGGACTYVDARYPDRVGEPPSAPVTPAARDSS